MNAGGHGSDMASCLAGVRVIDLRSGEDGEVPASALALGYRRSALAPHQLVVWADLALQEGEPDRSAALISEIVTWRRANQPGGPNRSEERTSELQSLMRISYAVFCLKKKKHKLDNT